MNQHPMPSNIAGLTKRAAGGSTIGHVQMVCKDYGCMRYEYIKGEASDGSDGAQFALTDPARRSPERKTNILLMQRLPSLPQSCYRYEGRDCSLTIVTS